MIYSLLTFVAFLLKLTTSTFVGPAANKFFGRSGGYANGFGTNAQFNYVPGMDISHNLKFALIADANNHQIRIVTRSTAQVSLLAGDPKANQGAANGFGTHATFQRPRKVTISPNDQFALVADSSNSLIRRIELSTKEVTVFAGSGNNGYSNGIGTFAQFHDPNGLDISPNGNYALVADSNHHQIRKINLATRDVTQFAGSSYGYADGVGSFAQFRTPFDISISPNGKFALVCDEYNNRIRKIILSTVEVSTLAGGTLEGGLANGIGTNANFNIPVSIVIYPDNSFALVADTNNHAVRKVVISTGEVSVYIGDGNAGSADGIGTNAQLTAPTGLAISPSGRSALVSSFSAVLVSKIQILPPPRPVAPLP